MIERIRGVHDSALYKSTFTYLLTYLLIIGITVTITKSLLTLYSEPIL